MDRMETWRSASNATPMRAKFGDKEYKNNICSVNENLWTAGRTCDALSMAKGGKCGRREVQAKSRRVCEREGCRQFPTRGFA